MKSFKTYVNGLDEKDSKYDIFFKKALKKFKISSVGELSDNEASKFFKWVDDNWDAQNEEVISLSSYFELINEEVTSADLKEIERMADKLFAKVGIDVGFTRHFLDRVNDARNKKPITTAEIIRIFKRTYKKYGKKIASMDKGAEAVLHDINSHVNIPFVLNWNKKTKEMEMISKTIMRKMDFKTPDQKMDV